MGALQDIHLVLFFTRGVSLRVWDDIGILEREAEIYRRLRPFLRRVSFVTYGNAEEYQYAPVLGDINILCNRWRVPSRLYTTLAPLLLCSELRTADVFKSNQVSGAQVAATAKGLYKKLLITRCGYLASRLAEARDGRNSVGAWRARRLEEKVFRVADRVVVTADSMKADVVGQYRMAEDKVWVIPNYVLTDIFVPTREVRGSVRRVIYVGRLDREKNVVSLVEALRGVDVELCIIGGGPLRAELERKVAAERIHAKFIGNIPHRELVQHLNQADLFVLPSLHEGHPKALLEAMACGVPVLGADVPGIREVITNGETGYLCGTSSEAIQGAIEQLMANGALRRRIAKNAREYVVSRFALGRVLEQEVSLLESLVGGDRRQGSDREGKPVVGHPPI